MLRIKMRKKYYKINENDLYYCILKSMPFRGENGNRTQIVKEPR